MPGNRFKRQYPILLFGRNAGLAVLAQKEYFFRPDAYDILCYDHNDSYIAYPSMLMKLLEKKEK